MPIWGWCDTLSEWACDGVVMSSKERKPCEFILDLWVCIINSICPSAINTACLTGHPLPRFFHTSISPSHYTPRLTPTHFSTPHITHHPLLPSLTWLWGFTFLLQSPIPLSMVALTAVTVTGLTLSSGAGHSVKSWRPVATRRGRASSPDYSDLWPYAQFQLIYLY